VSGVETLKKLCLLDGHLPHETPGAGASEDRYKVHEVEGGS